ncbi:uncharacterized protein TNCV_2717541 [Trichonephila clavipes]|nr:uncharacterized protein TNCV_2717541 [Trichonephila clavipes]
MSTDAKPMHSKCPEEKLSWCFYNRAKTDNKVPSSHKSMKTKLSEEVVAKFMPVYQRLASKEVLLRCVSGKTQNANESSHSCTWRKCVCVCLFHVFVSKRRNDLAATTAFSEVEISYVETLKLNNSEMGDAAIKVAHRRDNRRMVTRFRNRILEITLTLPDKAEWPLITRTGPGAYPKNLRAGKGLVMSRRKQRSAFDQISEFDRGSIAAYRDCGLSFREIGSRVGQTKQLHCGYVIVGCRRVRRTDVVDFIHLSAPLHVRRGKLCAWQ